MKGWRALPKLKQPKAAYAVGFARPPKASQFREGQSGNPNGRPKGKKNLWTIVQKEISQPVTVNGPQGQTTITKLEAVVMQIINKAAQGELRAAKEVFALVRLAAEANSAQPDLGDVPEEDQKVMQNLVRRMQALKVDIGNGVENR